MKKMITIVCAAYFCLHNLTAQNNDSTKISGSIVNFVGGYGYGIFNGIDQFFPIETLTLNENHFTFGAQILYVSKNFIYGFSGYTIYGDTHVGDSSEVTTQATIFTVDIGYLLTQQPAAKFKCYPLISIGYGSTMILHKSTKDLTVAEIQSDAFTETNLRQGTLFGDVALNMAYVLGKTSDDEFSKGGVSLGIQLGYTYGLGIGDWKFAGAKVTDAAAYNLSMPYAKLTFGFHSF
jgi:hypothetical protein